MYDTETLADFKQDFEELQYLLTDSINRLRRFVKDIRKSKKYIAPSTYEEMSERANQYIEACRVHDRYLKQETENLQQLKQSVFEFLRTHQTLIGALITSTDWQSPSFLHSITSQAGRQTGTIYGTINDYKRDQHWDAYRYEQIFLKNYIDGFIKFPIHVYATSSGMAAFTTILNYLLLEKKVTRPVLIGKSIYFENKILLLRAFPKTIIEVDESKTDDILRAIKIHDPSAIFFDSLCNSPDVSVLDLTHIIKYLTHCKQETFLIIDNTCLASTFQSFHLISGKFTKLRLIQFESLNKYHQFGFDRVTGGIITAIGGDTGKLFDYRDKLGTNITDSAVSSIPTPNRKIFSKRFARHQRNATLLAFRLQQWITDHPKSAFSTVSFPLRGSFLTIQFKNRFQNIPSYKRFVNIVINQATRQRVDLVSGTSFGMNTTRIYLTAIRNKPNMPFIRISAGTETKNAIEAVISVFLSSFVLFK